MQECLAEKYCRFYKKKEDGFVKKSLHKSVWRKNVVVFIKKEDSWEKKVGSTDQKVCRRYKKVQKWLKTTRTETSSSKHWTSFANERTSGAWASMSRMQNHARWQEKPRTWIFHEWGEDWDTDEERDIGVTINRNLKPTAQCVKAAGTAKQSWTKSEKTSTTGTGTSFSDSTSNMSGLTLSLQCQHGRHDWKGTLKPWKKCKRRLSRW